MKKTIYFAFIVSWLTAGAAIFPPSIPGFIAAAVSAIVLISAQVTAITVMRRPIISAAPANDLIIYKAAVEPLPGNHIVWYNERYTGTVNHTKIDDWQLFCETKGVAGWHYFEPVMEKLRSME